LNKKNAPWETFEFFILEDNEAQYDLWFEYQNNVFSSDGYFPQSFAEHRITGDDYILIRRCTLAELGLFYREDDALFNREVPSEHLPENDGFNIPDYRDNLRLINPNRDFCDLTISIRSASAEDASCYIWDIERLPFYPSNEFALATDTTVSALQKKLEDVPTFYTQFYRSRKCDYESRFFGVDYEDRERHAYYRFKRTLPLCYRRFT
jgi:hypothetical protein